MEITQHGYSKKQKIIKQKHSLFKTVTGTQEAVQTGTWV
jgi:hypothetical protein